MIPSIKNFDIVLEAQSWNGTQWIQIKEVDNTLEVCSSIGPDNLDMPYVHVIDNWDTIPSTVAGIIKIFLEDTLNSNE